MQNNTMISLIDIIINKEKVYDGDLRYYAKKLFFAKNVKNGYHNFRHMMHVVYQVYDGIKYMNVNTTAARILLIAAIFHDYGHSGDGTKSDSFNIQRAIKGAKRHIHPSDKIHLALIIDLIRATEWHGEVGHNILEDNMLIAILRDADMSQTFDNAWMQQVIFGLGTEKKLSPREMLQAQLPFLQTKVKFSSPWGKQKFTPILKQRIEEIKIWNNIVL